MLLDELGEIDVFQAEAAVGLVVAEAAHGFVERHAFERQLEVDAFQFFEHSGDDFFDDVEDVILFDEGHFDVELREFGLAIDAQIFVAETAHELEIAIRAGHHQELLEELRAFGQRVEFAFVQARRDEEIARAAGRVFDQERRFNFGEAEIGERAARDQVGFAAHGHQLLHDVAAQIEIAVFKADVVVGLEVVADFDRRRLGFIEHGERCGGDFDGAGRKLVVARAFGADAHESFDANDPFAAQFAGFFKQGFVLGSKTIWVTPCLSRRSRKITPPMSRLVCTHPDKTAVLPASDSRSWPQVWERYLLA